MARALAICLVLCFPALGGGFPSLDHRDCAAPGQGDAEESALLQLDRRQAADVASSLESRTGSGLEKYAQAQMDILLARSGAWKGAPAACAMSESEGCKLSQMTPGLRMMVKPGGETSCLDTDYSFLVTPGDSDKLVLYMQGGGACWNLETFYKGGCVRDLTTAVAGSGTMAGAGVFNKSDVLNAFQNHTLVEILHCTGDGHVGNTTRDWFGPRRQVGYLNAGAATSWAWNNMDRSLKSLVLMGDSIGALGVQGWARPILKQFVAEKAAVAVDARAGYFPENTVGPALASFGACSLPILSAEQQRLCSEGQLTVDNLMKDTVSEHPQVPFEMHWTYGQIL